MSKTMKILGKVIPNIRVPNIGDFIRIMCALINKFRPLIESSSESASLFAQKMLERSKLPNQLMSYLEQKSIFNKRSVLSNLCHLELKYFPTFNLTDCVRLLLVYTSFFKLQILPENISARRETTFFPQSMINHIF